MVTVFGADRIDGEPGIWMELIEGSTLRDVVTQDGPLHCTEAIRVGLALCDGLAAVHQAGLVHRDIKAQNVMREPGGRVILMDLGAGQEESDSVATVEGTPLYLAPEVLHGTRATDASDIYALGVLLFFLATGEFPVSAASIDDLRTRHAQRSRAPLPWPSHVTLPFRRVVERALAFEPGARFSSAETMRQALETAAVTPPVSRGSLVILALLLTATTAALSGLSGRNGATPVNGRLPAAGIALPLPDWPTSGPSRDGRHLSYVDSTGQLMLHELSTGRSTRVLETPADGTLLATLVSPFSDRIAYGWRHSDGSFELRSIGTDGRWPSSLMPPQPAYEPIPLDWSHDGRELLCRLRQTDGTSDLVLVSSDGGPARHLHTFTSGDLVQGRLSPDGRFAIMSALESYGGLGPLIIAPTDGSGACALLPGDDYALPAWMPDGKHVLVLREGTAAPDTQAAWLIPVDEGVATGEPVLAARDVGAPLGLWVTDDGALYRTTTSIWADVYTVDIDVTGATPPGPPSRIATRDLAHQVAPSWSPDGLSMAYIVREGPDSPSLGTRRGLRIKDLVFGNTRDVRVDLKFLGGYVPSWTPDGRYLAVWGRDGEGMESFGYYLVDIRTGETTSLVNIGENAPAYSQFSPDGRLFLYLHQPRGIVARDLVDGTEQVVVPVTAGFRVGTFALSPDGRSLAYAARYPAGEPPWFAVHVAALSGGNRADRRLTPPVRVVVHGWTPDGTGILYGTLDGQRQHLWRVSPNGGDPIDLRFDGPVTPNPFRLRPDGTRLAFTERIVHADLQVTRSVWETSPR